MAPQGTKTSTKALKVIRRPLPDQKAFDKRPLPDDILDEIETAKNTYLNKYDILNRNDYANFREQFKNKLFEICNENPNLNNGIYDFSKLSWPKLTIRLIEEISRAKFYEGRNRKF
jgi:hypothetical protein